MDQPKQSRIPRELVFSQEETLVIDKEIAKLLAHGVIAKCEKECDDFISKIFLRPKKDGSHRMILDLSLLNKQVVYRQFKMESFSTVMSMVTPKCYMASINIKDAYYSCEICPTQTK